MKAEPWMCVACKTPCTLQLGKAPARFMSTCCEAPVRPKKDADSP